MVNEDILTSLKNAVEKGESLDSAMQTAINSGYSSKDVQEAAQYIGSGVVNLEKISQDRMLTMPNEKKGFFSGLFSKKQPKQQIPQQSQQPVQYQTQQIQQPPQQYTNRTQTQSQEMSYSSIPLPQQSLKPAPIAPKPQAPRMQPMQQMQQLPPIQTQKQIKQNIAIPRMQPPPQPYAAPQYQTQPPRPIEKQSYAKEIILLIMLLILAGILIITFKYRNEIVAFFSG